MIENIEHIVIYKVAMLSLSFLSCIVSNREVLLHYLSLKFADWLAHSFHYCFYKPDCTKYHPALVQTAGPGLFSDWQLQLCTLCAVYYVTAVCVLSTNQTTPASPPFHPLPSVSTAPRPLTPAMSLCFSTGCFLVALRQTFISYISCFMFAVA